jgi:cell division septation protein DedD
MEKLILNLLKENSRIIIPEFGAFIIRQQNPPEIAFNSLLTFNDGILTEYVSHNSRISFPEAQAKVSDYAVKLNADLKLHNRLSFNEIGWVWLDESGEKQFTPWKSGGQLQTEAQKPMRDLETILKDADLNEKSGSEVIIDSHQILPDQVPFVLDDTIKEVEVDATRDNLIKQPVDDSLIKGDISDESFSLEETPVSGPGIDISEEPKQESETELLIQPKVDLSEALQDLQKEKAVTEPEIPKIGIRFKHEMPPEETVLAQMPDAAPEPDKKENSAETEVYGSVVDTPVKPIDEVWHEIEARSARLHEPPKKVKKRSWIIPVGIIGLFIIIAGAGYLFFPEQVIKILHPGSKSSVEIQPGVEIGYNAENNPSAADKKSEEESVEGTTPVINESETNEQQEAPVITEEPEPSLKKYYVVAGRFRSQQNAEKYNAELRSKGFNSEYFATDDNLYTVSFNSFSTKESAEAEMNRIRKSIEPKAWILYY